MFVLTEKIYYPVCQQEGGTYYPGIAFRIKPTLEHINSWLACSEKCREDWRCQYWAWLTDQYGGDNNLNHQHRKKCILHTKKDVRGAFVHAPYITSGDKSCGQSLTNTSGTGSSGIDCNHTCNIVVSTDNVRY